MNTPIVRLYALILLLFAALVGFTSYWAVFDSTTLKNEPQNRRPLIVEHIAARLRVVREYLLQHLAHGRPGGFRRRAPDMALDIGREDDFGHQFRSVGRSRYSLADPRTNGRWAFRQGSKEFLAAAGGRYAVAVAGLSAFARVLRRAMRQL